MDTDSTERFNYPIPSFKVATRMMTDGKVDGGIPMDGVDIPVFVEVAWRGTKHNDEFLVAANELAVEYLTHVKQAHLLAVQCAP